MCECGGLQHGVMSFSAIRDKANGLLRSFNNPKTPLITSMVLRMADFLESDMSRDSRTWAGLFPLEFIHSLIGRYCSDMPPSRSFQLCVSAVSAFQEIALLHAKAMWDIYNDVTHPKPQRMHQPSPEQDDLPSPTNTRRRPKRKRPPRSQTNTITSY